MYGPELNKETASGNDEVIRGIITNGTPRMPGFKYTYNPDQVAAIAAYVKTLAVGNQALTVPPAPTRPQ
jgi:mono/diheme cytochrome c family protein